MRMRLLFAALMLLPAGCLPACASEPGWPRVHASPHEDNHGWSQWRARIPGHSYRETLQDV